MKKVVVHKPGSYNQLKLEEHSDPNPQDTEVLVEVLYAGVNYADCCVRWGVYESAKEYVGWPITPGFEFAGRVSAAGTAVSNFKIGDEVFGVTRFGAYATKVCVPQDQLFLIPKALSSQQAAAFPTIFLTAYHALKQNVIVRPGSRILIHSAAGGVGSALVQLCLEAGHQVVGVVGASHKFTFLKQLGCTQIIDKSKQPLWQVAREFSPKGYDIIFDANGYKTFRDSYRHLAPTGKLIVYGSHTLLPKKGGRINYLKAAWGLLRTPHFNPLDMISENRAVLGFNLSFLFDHKDLLDEAMAALLGLLENGKIQPPSITPFPFAEVGNAHRALESGQTTGKIVLTL